jgi:LAS superfamily LD-carboxypeptidase LdcB
MFNFCKAGAVATCLLLAAACKTEGSDVQQQTRELREAQNNSPKVAKDLEADLEKAKAEVVLLEKKLALARQGITDDVIAERKDLEQSLRAQDQKVRSEIDKAKRASEANSQDTAKAAQQLEQTKMPARVEAEVQSRSNVVPSATKVETTERQELIPVTGRDTRTVNVDAGASAPRPAP